MGWFLVPATHHNSQHSLWLWVSRCMQTDCTGGTGQDACRWRRPGRHRPTSTWSQCNPVAVPARLLQTGSYHHWRQQSQRGRIVSPWPQSMALQLKQMQMNHNHHIKPTTSEPDTIWPHKMENTDASQVYFSAAPTIISLNTHVYCINAGGSCAFCDTWM